jgi:hypothetical protein
MKKEDVYARMMHTPDDPARAELRSALRDVWNQLLPLHRALIEASRAEFVAGGGVVNGPGHLLQLLQDDPVFAWLRPLTSLIVDIDSMTSTDFVSADVDAIAARTERLFDGDAEFSARYLPALQHDVDVAIHHAGVRQVLPRLIPQAPRE